MYLTQLDSEFPEFPVASTEFQFVDSRVDAFVKRSPRQFHFCQVNTVRCDEKKEDMMDMKW